MNYQFKNNSLDYCALHDALDSYYAPMFGEADFDSADWKGPARAQLELWALASRRARATLELSGRLAVCTSPMGAMAAYSDYWQSAFSDCAESTKRMVSMFGHAPAETRPVEEPQKAVRKGVSEPSKFPSSGERGYRSRQDTPSYNGVSAPELYAARLRAS